MPVPVNFIEKQRSHQFTFRKKKVPPQADPLNLNLPPMVNLPVAREPEERPQSYDPFKV